MKHNHNKRGGTAESWGRTIPDGYNGGSTDKMDWSCELIHSWEPTIRVEWGRVGQEGDLDM